MDVLGGRFTTTTSVDQSLVRPLAAALAFVSQIIHLWILPETVVVTVLPGLFFLTVAVGQGLLGVGLLFGPGRWTLRLGTGLNLLAVCVWAVTRIVSLPELTGSAHHPVGSLGVTAVVVEITLVALLLKLVPR